MIPALPRLSVAHLPTPVHPLPRLLRALMPDREGLPKLWVKRDDLTGAELSGNKVRKLEFLLQEALSQGADVVVTCGGVQSNHCRATALLCARLGLSCVLLLRTVEPVPRLSGNLLLDRLAGAEVRLITLEQYRERARLMAEIREELAGKGRRAYLIPEGGSNALGSLGYAHCVAELCGQVGAAPLTLCHATGSGGTFAGLVLGVAVLGLPWRVVGFAVCDDRAYFVNRTVAILQEAAERFGLEAARRLCQRPEDLDVRDGYVGRGYALSRPEELRLIAAACRSEGLVLDPVYTGKALFGLCAELSADPAGLGERVVFVHTGGIFGLLAEDKGAEMAAVLSSLP
jgi:D-cysteine desulfhydrase